MNIKVGFRRHRKKFFALLSIFSAIAFAFFIYLFFFYKKQAARGRVKRVERRQNRSEATHIQLTGQKEEESSSGGVRDSSRNVAQKPISEPQTCNQWKKEFENASTTFILANNSTPSLSSDVSAHQNNDQNEHVDTKLPSVSSNSSVENEPQVQKSSKISTQNADSLSNTDETPVSSQNFDERAAQDFRTILESFRAREETDLGGIRDLKQVFDFDVNEYSEETQRLVKPIEAMRAMTPQELRDLVTTSEAEARAALSDRRYADMYGHEANASMAKLLLQKKPDAIEQSYVDAWRDSGFAANGAFIDLVRECERISSAVALNMYCGYLVDHSTDWNSKAGVHLIHAFDDKKVENMEHWTANMGIPFLYRGMTILKGDFSQRFEDSFRENSVEKMRQLARDVVQSGQYSDDQINQICQNTSYNDKNVANSQACLIMSFQQEFRLLRNIRDANVLKNEVQQMIGFDPQFEEQIENRDPCALVAKFKGCIAVGGGARGKCAKLFDSYWRICYLRSKAENVDAGAITEEGKYAKILRDVVYPATIFLNSMLYLQKYNNEKFLKDLEHYDIFSYEEALANRKKLKDMDVELYSQLLLIEKCLDYQNHADDFDYIKGDYAKLQKLARVDYYGGAYSVVDQVVTELKKSNEVQRCTFDMNLKKLSFKDTAMKQVLAEIYKNKDAAKLLKNFLINAVSLNSLPTAITTYLQQSKRLHAIESSSYKIMADISEQRPLESLV